MTPDLSTCGVHRRRLLQLVAGDGIAAVAAACNAGDGYADSLANFARTSLERDNVFADDGATSQLATVTGDAVDGYAATLDVGV